MAVFGLYFLPTLLSQNCPGQLLVPVWVTQQLEQASLFNIFWKCLCFERAGPMWRTLHFLQFTSFAAQMFGCFLGAYVSKLPELCWNSYFRTGDGNLYLCLVEWHKKIKSYFFMTMIPPTLNHKKLKIQTWSWSRILFFYWTDPITMVEKEFWSVHRVSVGTTDRNFFTCQYTLLHFLWVSWLSPSWETSTEHREWKWHIYLALSPFIPF